VCGSCLLSPRLRPRCPAEVQAAATVGPVLVHVVTDKGHGYQPAETSQDKMHGVQRFDPLTGEQFTVRLGLGRHGAGRSPLGQLTQLVRECAGLGRGQACVWQTGAGCRGGYRAAPQALQHFSCTSCTCII
jgi:hypothetical protein